MFQVFLWLIGYPPDIRRFLKVAWSWLYARQLEDAIMAKLLYVTCDLRPFEQSCCLLAGLDFLDQYLKRNPRAEIHMLDLYRDPVQSADPDVLSALEKMARGHHLATLTTDEQRKISRMSALAGQFAAADKYVFVTPMWKPGLPSKLWEYLDAILVAGTTYRNTAAGPVGLLQEQRRKCLLIHAAEGFVCGERELPCVSSIRDTIRFLGVRKFSSILIHGAHAPREGNAALIMRDRGQLEEAALTF